MAAARQAIKGATARGTAPETIVRSSRLEMLSWEVSGECPTTVCCTVTTVVPCPHRSRDCYCPLGSSELESKFSKNAVIGRFPRAAEVSARRIPRSESVLDHVTDHVRACKPLLGHVQPRLIHPLWFFRTSCLSAGHSACGWILVDWSCKHVKPYIQSHLRHESTTKQVKLQHLRVDNIHP